VAVKYGEKMRPKRNTSFARFQFFITMLIKIEDWNLTLCRPLNSYQTFEGTRILRGVS